MKLPMYPKYKDSGVEWLGEVPEHWEITPVTRKAVAIQTGPFGSQLHEADYVEGGIPLINPMHIVQNVLAADDRSAVDEATAQRLSRHRLLVDDIVMARRGEIGRCGIVTTEEEGWLCGTGSLVLRLRGCDPRYMVRVLSGQGFSNVLELRAVGTTMLNLSPGIVGRMLIPSPPESEQREIADFLDGETARIDKLVEKKRTLIERLKEKRTALISRTVTRGLPPDAARAAGLDPHPKLKPSGIDWLGQVPEHWETGNLRRFALMRTGHTPSRTESSYWETCEVPWFTLADVWQLRDNRNIYLGKTKERISLLGLENSSAELLPRGTVVFSRTASVGLSGIMPTPMATTQDFWNWIPGSRLLPEYLLFLFRSMAQEFQKLTMGSTHKTIYQPDAARLSIPIPPLPEQHAISEYVIRGTGKIDDLVSKVETAIERLQEYRSALITAAVTGKIDVRNTGVNA